MCAGLQYAVSKHLCQRLQRGIEFTEYKVRHYDFFFNSDNIWFTLQYFGQELMSAGTLVVSGGVASNQFIRSRQYQLFLFCQVEIF